MYICIDVYKDIIIRESVNTVNSDLAMNNEIKQTTTAPNMNWALVKIEASFFANKLSEAKPNKPNTTKIFNRISNELFPKSYAVFSKKKFTSISKNSVPTTPSKVKKTNGKRIIVLPSDFENKYEKLKQSDTPKTSPNEAWVSSLSKKPQLKTALVGRRFSKVK